MTEPREIATAAEEVVPGLWTWSISNSNIGGHVSTLPGGAHARGLPARRPGAPRRRGARRAAAPDGDAAHRALPPARRVALPRASSARRSGCPRTPRRPTSSRTTPTPTGSCCRAGCARSARPAPSGRTTRSSTRATRASSSARTSLEQRRGGLHFINPAFHEDPAATRTSVEHLLGLPFGILCFAHGAPGRGRPQGRAARGPRAGRLGNQHPQRAGRRGASGSGADQPPGRRRVPHS